MVRRLTPVAETGMTKEQVKALNDEDPVVRKDAVLMLGRMGLEANDAVPALVAALQDDQDPDVRMTVAWTLCRIGEPDAVPALAAALKDRHNDVRAQSALSLGVMGPAAQAAVPALAAALRDDEDAMVRENAARALGNIGRIGFGTQETVPALSMALTDPDDGVRMVAAKALGVMGPAAQDAVPALVAALRDPGPDVRYEAAEALAAIRGS